MNEQPIYVVVMATGGKYRYDGDQQGGPIVMETEVDGATLERAHRQAATLEPRYGACRIGRVIFEDHPAF